ncbi:MAG: hypothetical protein HOH74_03630, partial [Gemmatimonadetes bacterium]|nr:hypothetical protein [Gemmatimonadota bacterium]
ILDDTLVETLTPQDVQRAAGRWFNTERHARFVLMPQDDAMPEQGPASAGEEGGS